MEDSAFDSLFDIAAKRGPALNTLLDRANIKLAANLKNAAPGRFAALVIRLGTWEGKGQFNKLVDKFLREGLSKRAQQKAEDDVAQRLDAATAKGIAIIQVAEPVKVAQDFRALLRPNLLQVAGAFLDYEAGAYREIPDRVIKAALQRYMSSGVDAASGKPFTPSKRDLDEAFEMLIGESVTAAGDTLGDEIEDTVSPRWLVPTEGLPDPKMLIASPQCILNLMTGEQMAPTPNFFTRNAVSYDLTDWVSTPAAWLTFLESIWPDAKGGKQNKEALQEVMGHLLTQDTKHQKVFMLVGAPRAGKGTIVRVLTALIGKRNVHSQSVSKLGKDFGIAALIGKQLMSVPDLRFGKDANIGRIIETILNISGEDDVSVDRKFKDDKQVRLTTRLLLSSNLDVVLPDQSGALNSRYFPLVLKRSFASNPDLTLTERLMQELPGILEWSREGLLRLESRRDADGRPVGFMLTDEGRDLLTENARKGSSVKAFVNEWCVLDENAVIHKQPLLDAFEAWALDHEVSAVHTVETFGKELLAATGYAVNGQFRPNSDGGIRRFKGITLKPEYLGRKSDDVDGGY